MDKAFALFIVSDGFQVKGLFDSFQGFDFVIFVFVISLVNT
jgi:hypothetical protein